MYTEWEIHQNSIRNKLSINAHLEKENLSIERIHEWDHFNISFNNVIHKEKFRFLKTNA